MVFSLKNKMDFNRKINDGFGNFLVTFPCNLKSQTNGSWIISPISPPLLNSSMGLIYFSFSSHFKKSNSRITFAESLLHMLETLKLFYFFTFTKPRKCFNFFSSSFTPSICLWNLQAVKWKNSWGLLQLQWMEYNCILRVLLNKSLQSETLRALVIIQLCCDFLSIAKRIVPSWIWNNCNFNLL